MIVNTLYEYSLSDEIAIDNTLTRQSAEKLFDFFNNSSLFNWSDANNNCEGRANAACILLDSWSIPNAKAWAFSGYVFNKIGYLKNLWKYHVAACVPVMENDAVIFYVIDPATTNSLITLVDWAVKITDNPHSFYLLKNSDLYIFNAKKIKRDNWHKRDRRNFNWTMLSLSGINGLSAKGRAVLAFNKKKIPATKKKFRELEQQNYNRNLF